MNLSFCGRVYIWEVWDSANCFDRAINGYGQVHFCYNVWVSVSLMEIQYKKRKF